MSQSLAVRSKELQTFQHQRLLRDVTIRDEDIFKIVALDVTGFT